MGTIYTILSTISDSLGHTIMLAKICSGIMDVRREYGDRRSEMSRKLALWSMMSQRRERVRTIRITSRKSIYHRMVGSLRRGERKDIRRLNKIVADNKGDIRRTMMCLREATLYLDDVVLNPRLVRDARYKMWKRSLDFFLTEMRFMMDYRKHPGKYEVDILECLISRLGGMRINESLDEQIIMRFSLEEVVKTMFQLSRAQRHRLMGA